MPTDATVFFATNRTLTGDPELVPSYSPNIQPPTISTGIVYGTAFIEGIDIANDQQGTISSIQEVSVGNFSLNVIGDLAQAGRNILVFIHGFDNTFEDGLTRAAFNQTFLAGSGEDGTKTTVIAFSWPSLGRIIGFPILTSDYRHDQTAATNSGAHIMSFFTQIEPILRAARANGSRTYLLAHSMGNLALESAATNWFLHQNGNAELFNVAILAAADCRYDSFEQPSLAGLDGLSLLAGRISIYYSAADKVVDLSTAINFIPRLGHDGPKNRTNKTQFPAATYKMFDATGVTDYPMDGLNSHQYYRLSPTVRTAIAIDMSPTAWA